MAGTNYGIASKVPILDNLAYVDADTLIRSFMPNEIKSTPGGYVYYHFDDQSEIIINPDGVVYRIPLPLYEPDGKRMRGWRINIHTGEIARPHSFAEEKVNLVQNE